MVGLRALASTACAHAALRALASTACARAALRSVACGDGVCLFARPGGARGALTGESNLSAEAICARLEALEFTQRLQKAN